MQTNQRYLSSIVIVVAFALSLVGTLAASTSPGNHTTAPPIPIIAQEGEPPLAACEAALLDWYELASDACIGGPTGHICNGGMGPKAEPDGPATNSLVPTGALVPISAITGLTTSTMTADGRTGGLAWFRAEEQGYSMLLLGEVSMRDQPVPNFPVWQNIALETGSTESDCIAAPSNMLVLQNSDIRAPTNLGVNGVSVALNGTVIVQTVGDETIYSVVEGVLRLIANGQPVDLIAGQQSSAAHAPGDFSRAVGAPADPVPYDLSRVDKLPVYLLDRPLAVPQPGYVVSRGAVNLRTGPSTNTAIITQVSAGVTMTILGQNPARDWYHVRLPIGVTGWMFGELLTQNHGEIVKTYNATPQPAQRLGPLGQTATVLASTGATVRRDPDVQFGAIDVIPLGTQVELLARSPYSPWVKVRSDVTEGWVALITLETRAIVEALPVDFTVAPQPTPRPPTAIPGTTGNAFPDPSCWPNC